MKKTTIQYILALIACFVVGCGIALGLNAYDRHSERITPISGGQTVDFSAYGFTLTVPDDFSLNDYTTNNAAEGGNALFAGCVYGSLGELYLFCYANESGDSLRQHREQDVVTYYMNAAAASSATARRLTARTARRRGTPMKPGTAISSSPLKPA